MTLDLRPPAINGVSLRLEPGSDRGSVVLHYWKGRAPFDRARTKYLLGILRPEAVAELARYLTSSPAGGSLPSDPRKEVAPMPAATATETKLEPTGKVAKYIESLRTEPERRYATLEWRRLAGGRKTRPTPFDLTSGRAKTIRDQIAELVA